MILAMLIVVQSLWATDLDLDRAFQVEYAHLVSQKEALLRQRARMEKTFAEKTAEKRRAVERMQAEVTQLSVANDERFEVLMALERRKKELDRRGVSLEATFKRATRAVAEQDRALRFDAGREKTDPVPPQNLNLEQVIGLLERANQNLRASSISDQVNLAYFDQKGELREGSVTRFGRVAAVVQDANGRTLLGPSGAGGPLKALEKVSNRSHQVFVFDNLNEAAHVLKKATWLENLADLGPLMFLLLMMALVSGLFFILAKI